LAQAIEDEKAEHNQNDVGGDAGDSVPAGFLGRRFELHATKV
jgi:hypothetical protein